MQSFVFKFCIHFSCGRCSIFSFILDSLNLSDSVKKPTVLFGHYLPLQEQCLHKTYDFLNLRYA